MGKLIFSCIIAFQVILIEYILYFLHSYQFVKTDTGIRNIVWKPGTVCYDFRCWSINTVHTDSNILSQNILIIY